MTSKEALQIMLEFTAPQGEKQHLECSEAYLKLNRDLEILEILKKYIVYDKELNAIKCDGFVLTETHRKEDYEKTMRWLNGKD